jgi:hypothetical protein
MIIPTIPVLDSIQESYQLSFANIDLGKFKLLLATHIDDEAHQLSDAEVKSLVLKLSKANPLWGAPRIHGELLKLSGQICEGQPIIDSPFRFQW